MHQSTDTHRTAKELSPAELAAYRERLDAHFRSRQVDEALLQRAWQTAYRVAAMLYEDFGATRVAVFGSLAERDWFSKGSDIDIAVWGLSNSAYLRAAYDVYYLSPEFKVDLVDFDSCKGRFRERIESQAVPIQIGETGSTEMWKSHLMTPEAPYEVSRRKLLQRIADERAKMERAVTQMKCLENIEEIPVQYRTESVGMIALSISRFYSGLENIFRRVAREIDGRVPKGEDWQKALLVQMTQAHLSRPPVISPETAEKLHPILRFRHRFNNSYLFEIKRKKTLRNARQVCTMFDSVSEQLDKFVACVEKRGASR